MKVLDTSFLVSLYCPEDQNNKRAIEILESNTQETMLLSDIILFETLTVLLYKKGIQSANEAYQELAKNRCISYIHHTKEEHREIVAMFLSQQRNLSVADVSVVYLARNVATVDILTFDKEILQQHAQNRK